MYDIKPLCFIIMIFIIYIVLKIGTHTSIFVMGFVFNHVIGALREHFEFEQHLWVSLCCLYCELTEIDLETEKAYASYYSKMFFQTTSGLE